MKSGSSKPMKQTIEDDDVYAQYRAFVLSNGKRASETFLMEVMERFQKEPKKFIGFRSLLENWRNRRIHVGSLEKEITKLLAEHNDLILKFNAFLPQDDDNDNDDDDDDETTVEEDGDSDDGVSKLVAAIEFMNNLKIRFQDDDEHVAEFVRIMKQIEEGKPLVELKNKLAALFRDHSDLIEEFNRVVSENSTSSTPKIIKEKQIVESIQELDISKCQQIAPSYWLLPKNYLTPLASFRSEMDAQVLNEKIVCVSQDSGNYSCNQTQRTQQEEMLHQCEDHRFELDMLLEYMISAAERVKKLMNRIANNPEGCSIEIVEHLSVSDLRSIERLYGDYGPDILENLRRNPSVALPLVLNRLKEKCAELIEYRSDFNEVWVRVCANNHDELSSLRTKNLMAESYDQFKEKVERKAPMAPKISSV